MTCPNCGRSAGFTEHEAEHVERHGLDCGPYERYTSRWLTCNRCGAYTDELELNHDLRLRLDKPPKHV